MWQQLKFSNQAWVSLCGIGLLVWFAACMPLNEPPSSEGKLASVKQAVVGGKPDNSQPAVGGMVTKSAKSSYCTGTLIGSRLVITAAHCITNRSASAVQFRIDVPNGSGGITKTYYDIAQQVAHPKYGRTSRGLVNDVAVAILAKDVTGVAPMPINTQAMGNNWVGRKIFFIGYGLISTNPRQKPSSKYSAEIPLTRLLSDRFETKTAGKSICSGDSGGPALYKINGRMTLVGVNSYVTGRSSGGRPYCDGSGWDFRVDIYNSWLQPYLTKYGGKCTTDQDCGGCFACEKSTGKCKPKSVTQTPQFCGPCSGSCSNGGTCQPTSDGFRCLQPCDASRCCPTGSTCQKVGGTDQCVPDQNVCPPWKCQADKDCGAGEACTSGVCKPAPVQPAPTLCKKCSTNADCKGGICSSYPEGKYCTQPCSNKLFCPSGYACKSISGSDQCAPTSGICGCKSDSDCYSGFACSNGRCLRQGGGKYGDACDSVRRCAQGYRCIQQNGKGTCFQACQGAYPSGVPGATCGGSTGRSCQSGSRCLRLSGVGNVCFRTCSSSGQCVNGGSCRRLSNNLAFCYCTADSQCKNGATCNRDRVSSLGQCAKKSNSGSQCSAGFTCQNTTSGYLCVGGSGQDVGQECSSTRRCQSGLVCARTDRGNSVCIRRCTSNSSCSKEGGQCIQSGNIRFCVCNSAKCNSGYVCKDISSRNKVCTRGSSTGGCRSDSDCSGTQTCQGGKCQDQPACRSDIECPSGQVCKSGKCVAKPGCSSDADCKDTKLQCKNGQCVPKATGCSSDQDCAAGQKCNTQSGACEPSGGCKSDNECEASEQCTQGKCVPRASGCTDDNTCPAGQRCVNGSCVTPPSEGSSGTDAGAPGEKGKESAGAGADGGGSEGTTPKPPSKGCLCSVSSSSEGIPVALLLLLLLPLLLRRRSALL